MLSQFLNAFKKAKSELTLYLMQEGFNVTNDSFPLHWACDRGHIEIVKALIDNGIDVNSMNDNENTPLHLACFKGRTDIIKLLIDSGAEVNSANVNGCIPLHSACDIGHIEIVKLLINNGADVNLAGNDGHSPFHFACDNLACDNWTRDNLACNLGHIEIVNLLINNGADVNLTNVNGHTPLYLACLKGHTEIAKLIIDTILFKNPDKEKPDFIKEFKIFLDYWDEILSLKAVRFKKFSLFDHFFTEDLNKLEVMCCEEQLSRLINTKDIKKYPLTGYKIIKNFEKGLIANKALRILSNSCNNEGEKFLPPELWKKILENLKSSDIENISNIIFFKLVSNNPSKIKENNSLLKLKY